MSAFSWMGHPASFFGWALRIITPRNDWPFIWKLRLIGCRVPPFPQARYVSSQDEKQPYELTTNLLPRTRCPSSTSLTATRSSNQFLFKTAIYWVATFIARLVERFMHFSVVDRNRPADFGTYLIFGFSWQRFSAISLLNRAPVRSRADALEPARGRTSRRRVSRYG